MSGSSLGRYELITQIGQGGMAEVHLALQRGPAGFEKLVVLKILHAALAGDAQVVAALLDEAKLAALIKHPNVVDMYELGEEAGRYFLAMEFLEGEPLLAVLEAGHAGPRLDPLSMARIVADTAEGLEAAHQLKDREGTPLDLVHDDLSLGNIVVLYSGQVKLVDFGVAKAKHSAGTSENVFGKPGYMAPEKLDGKPANRLTDVWSLGVVLWEALAHQRLFRGTTPTETIREVRYLKITPPSLANPVVPPALDAVAMKALERDPAQRYQSAKALAVAIEAALRASQYDARNDRIAAYMQGTFAERIRERAKLVAAAGPPPDAGRAVAAPPTTQPPTTQPPTTQPPTTQPTSALPPTPQPTPALPPSTTAGSRELHAANAAGRRLAAAHDPAQAIAHATPAPRSHRHVLPYAVGSLAVLAILAAIVLATRDDASPREIVRASHDAAVVILSDAELLAVIPPDATEGGAPVTSVASPDATVAVALIDAGDAPIVEEIEMSPGLASGSSGRRRASPARRPAHLLYAEGMQWSRKGEPRKALASLTEARRSNDRYTPVWYGLGVVYEQLGERSAAKRAYQRYLKLAPKAANAQLVRERADRL